MIAPRRLHPAWIILGALTVAMMAASGLRKRLQDRRIHLEVTEAARTLLAREGYDPTYGARPLKRTIQRLVQDPLALRLLEREFVEGDTVVVDAHGDEIAFRKEVTAEVTD